MSPGRQSDDRIRLRQFDALDFKDPATVLRGMRELERNPAILSLRPEVRELRTRRFRPHLERRQALLFSYGMGKLIGTLVHVAEWEDADFDFVTRRVENNVLIYTPLQLKEAHEVVSVDELNSELAKLTRYAGPSDTNVAIWVNGRFRCDLAKLVVPPLKLGGVWLYGAISKRQDRWMLIGDLLGDVKTFEWDYPA